MAPDSAAPVGHSNAARPEIVIGNVSSRNASGSTFSAMGSKSSVSRSEEASRWEIATSKPVLDVVDGIKIRKISLGSDNIQTDQQHSRNRWPVRKSLDRVVDQLLSRLDDVSVNSLGLLSRQKSGSVEYTIPNNILEQGANCCNPQAVLQTRPALAKASALPALESHCKGCTTLHLQLEEAIKRIDALEEQQQKTNEAAATHRDVVEKRMDALEEEQQKTNEAAATHRDAVEKRMDALEEQQQKINETAENRDALENQHKRTVVMGATSTQQLAAAATHTTATLRDWLSQQHTSAQGTPQTTSQTKQGAVPPTTPITKGHQILQWPERNHADSKPDDVVSQATPITTKRGLELSKQVHLQVLRGVVRGVVQTQKAPANMSPLRPSSTHETKVAKLIVNEFPIQRRKRNTTGADISSAISFLREPRPSRIRKKSKIFSPPIEPRRRRAKRGQAIVASVCNSKCILTPSPQLDRVLSKEVLGEEHDAVHNSYHQEKLQLPDETHSSHTLLDRTTTQDTIVSVNGERVHAEGCGLKMLLAAAATLS